MRLVILSRSRNLHSTRRLYEEAKRLNTECLVINPLRCQLAVGRDGPEVFVYGKRLDGVDTVLPRIGTSITEYGLLVVRQFECMGVTVVNPAQAILDSRNKFRAMQACGARGLDMPYSVISRSLSDLPSAMRMVRQFPMVMKLLQGAQGIGVMLGHDRSAVESVMATMLTFDKDIVLQQFVKESEGSDVRVLVIGGKVVAAMRRRAKKGEFRANVHRGGWGEKISRLPKSYERMALLATKAVGLDIAGVDLLESAAGPKFLEINSSPGFQELEKATGINVAEQMVKMMISKARRKKRVK